MIVYRHYLNYILTLSSYLGLYYRFRHIHCLSYFFLEFILLSNIKFCRDEANEEFVELSYCSKKAKLRDKGGRFAASYTATPNKVSMCSLPDFAFTGNALKGIKNFE